MSAGSTLVIDTVLWPVVVITPHGQFADVDLQKLMDTFDGFWERGEKFVTVSDMSGSRNVSSRQRQMVGEWLKKSRPSIERCSVGAVLIMDSALLRGALTAIGWIYQAPLDTTYVKNWAQAADTAIALLEKAGVTVPGLRARMLEFGRSAVARVG